MNIGEIKRQIMGLAFEDQASMSEYNDIVNDSINRAIQEIHSTVRPILDLEKINQFGNRDGIIRYDMPELTKENGLVVFMDFANKITIEEGSGYKLITDYKTENRKILLLPAYHKGNITVWYKRIPKQITDITSATEELELDYEVQILVPFLASYYVWLDDDERKAVQYYNRYDELKQSFIEKPKATITGCAR